MTNQKRLFVEIQGGLGNQMFQYATGLAMSLRTDRELELNLAQLEANKRSGTITPREFGLDSLRIGRFERNYEHPLQLTSESNLKIVEEKSPFIHQELEQEFEPDKDVMLRGGWQSFKYFEHLKSELKMQFQASQPMSTDSLKLMGEIGSTHAICVHVRRGDYTKIKNRFYHFAGQVQGIAQMLNIN
jgi:hypothetical protein